MTRTKLEWALRATAVDNGAASDYLESVITNLASALRYVRTEHGHSHPSGCRFCERAGAALARLAETMEEP